MSGIHYATPTSTVYDELNAIKHELLIGIGRRTNDDDACNVTLASVIGPTLLPFINKLKQYLDVDQRSAWNVFCGYIENEYSDSIDQIKKQQQNFFKIEANADKLLESIWHYYSIERMTQLKIVRNLLELDRSPKNPYAREYAKILEQIGMKKLRRSFIEQLKQLVHEPAPFKGSHTELFNVRGKVISWTERRLREIIEILQILLLIVDRDQILVDEFRTLVQLFKFHSFGKQQPYLGLNGNNTHKELVVKITYCEITLFMLCIDSATDIERLREIAQLFDKDIVMLHQNAEHGPILLSWMLMNFKLIELRGDSPEFQRFQQYGTKAAKLGVFDYLVKMLSHPMYRDQSLAGTISCQVISNLLSNLCDIFDCERIVEQHQNIFDLLAELLKNPTIALVLCTGAENGIKSLFNASIKRFPLDFAALSMIAYSVTTSSAESASYVSTKYYYYYHFHQHYQLLLSIFRSTNRFENNWRIYQHIQNIISHNGHASDQLTTQNTLLHIIIRHLAVKSTIQ